MFTRRQSSRKAAGAMRYNETGTFVPSTHGNFYAEDYNTAKQEPTQENQWSASVAEVVMANTFDNIQTGDNFDGQNNDNESFSQNNTIITPTDSAETSGDKKLFKWKGKGIKISMREKRRRQNLQLRRLLTPKNAQMILNELTPGTQHECTVVPDVCLGNKQYVATVNVEGVEFRGVGQSKIHAKMAAAENAVRDMMLKQMNKLCQQDMEVDPNNLLMQTDEDSAENQLPMMQLASFALHKLFSEWQAEGYKVPQLSGGSRVESKSPNRSTTVKPKKTPTMPHNPEQLHPCMLVKQMYPTAEYTMVECKGVKPNIQIFTMQIEVNGMTFVGSGQNKKEARRMAAKAACEEVFKIQYPEEPKPAMVVM